MNFNRIVVITCILLAIFTMGAVSASDINETSDLLTVSEDDSLDMNFDCDIIADGSDKTFDDLNTLIATSSENDVIELEYDYICTNASDSGINISKKLTIDGKGHKIDGKGISRAFSVFADDVILRNINFVNTQSGAVMWIGDNGNVSDCSFTNCSSVDGGAMRWSGIGGTVTGCSFTNCSATTGSGGAIYWDGDDGSVLNCIFSDCSSAGYGGAIHFDGSDGSAVVNCKFVNCSSVLGGGSIYFNGYGGAVLGSLFTFSDVESIVVRAVDDSHIINVSGCTFESSKTDDPAAAIYGASITGCYLNGVRIDKYPTVINIEVCDINYTESEVINFTIMTNASLPVYTWVQIVDIILECNGTVLINSSTNYGDEVKSYEFSDLDAGTYNVTLIFTSSGDYEGSNVTATFKVLPVTPQINVTCQNTIRQGKKLEVSVSTDLDSGIMQLSIDANNYTLNITGGNGTMNISGLPVGNHTLVVAFAGNDNYNPNSTAVAVSVTPAIFEDLRDEIDAASDELILNKDYMGNGSMITISKDNFVIDGQGHTLDANDMSGIFEITGNNVTLINISLINANSFDYVIDWQGSNGAMIGCDVRYSSGRNKTGSIYWQGANGIVANCSFANCSAQLGGAIYWDSDGGTVGGCSFTNCSAVYGGGALNWDARNGTIRDCSFENCYAKYGGAIYGYGDFGSILDCAYLNCIASVEGDTVYVYRLETSLNIESRDIVCGESEIINLTLAGPWSPVSDGDVNIILKNGQEIVTNESVSTDSSGIASYTFANLTAGTYNVTAIFLQYGDYAGSNVTATFTVSKIASSTEIIATSIDVGQIAAVNVTLRDEYDYAISDENITLVIYDWNDDAVRNVTLLTDASGAVSYDLVNMTAGSYTVRAFFYGTDTYVQSNTSSMFTVSKMIPSINVTSDNIYFGENETVTVNLPSDATNTVRFILNYDIEVNLNENMTIRYLSYDVSDISEGVSSWSYSDLPVGKYKVDVTYLGDDKYVQVSSSTNFTVSKVNSPINFTAYNINYGENETVTVNLPSDATGYVSIYLNGAVLANVTVEDAMADYYLASLNVGIYDVFAAYSGDEKYNPANASAVFEVAKVASQMVVECEVGIDAVEITVYSSVDGNMSVQFNGMSYPVSVIGGIGHLSVNTPVSGNYTVTVTFPGDINHNPGSNSTSIYVALKPTDIILALNASSTTLGESISITAILLSYNQTIGNASIDLIIGDSAIGILSGVPYDYIPAMAGEYAAVARFNGDDRYLAAQANRTFSVDKLTPQILLSASEIGWGEVETVEATITNGTTGNIVLMLSKNGVSLINQTVAISNGTVSHKFQNLAIGLYNLTAVYAGDSIYSGISNSTAFRVKPSNSFADLQTLINNTGDVLTLVQDYYGTGTPLVISRAITIDGAGHTIDANLESRILNVEAGVTLKNIRFTNGYGSAIYSIASGVSIINCIFENCLSDAWGGALNIKGGSCLIENCQFFNNHAGVGGGAVYLNGTNNRIVASVFENNYVAGNVEDVQGIGASCMKGGDVLSSDMYGKDSLLGDVQTPQGGGAVYDDGRNLVIDNCTFTNNTAEGSYGGAVRANDNANIRYSTFKDNKALTGSSVWCKDDATFTSNTFVLSDGEHVDDVIAGVPSRDVLKASRVYTEDDVMITTPEMTVSAMDLVIGENETVSAHLPGDSEGKVTFYIYGGNELIANGTGIVVSGRAYYDFANFTYGVYKVEANYSGDGRYYDAFASTFFVVRPKVEIAQNVTVEEDGNIYIEFANVTDSIVIKIDGRSFSVQDIDEGILNFTFSTAKMSAGDHTVTFIYEGDAFDENIFNYWDAGSGRFRPYGYNMYIAPIEITIEEDVLESGNDGVIVVELPDDATGALEVFIDGVKYTVVDVVNGIARVDLSEFKDGNYEVIFAYSGDSKYSTFTKQSVAMVKNDVPSVILAEDMTMIYSASGIYTARAITKTGKAVGGVTVTFSINGRECGRTTTNGEGFASIGVSALPGTYKITASISGASTTKTLKVKHVVSLKKVSVKKSAKKLVLTVSLAKVNGKFLKSKKVTFKFNGKKYTAKTNKKGVAKVTVKQNVLKKLKVGKKVTYQATYLKDTVKQSVKVKK